TGLFCFFEKITSIKSLCKVRSDDVVSLIDQLILPFVSLSCILIEQRSCCVDRSFNSFRMKIKT
ncbi:hypothetical protein MH187_19750, partial [Bacillus pumilus]|uniref:hypothetical protein n=2 Tax=Bacillus pumilus TaxID=1408 RepID=UPI00227E2A3F